jgi:osmoprotectant transport system ATP-binding protein
VIELDGLTKRYGSAPPAVDQLSLAVATGEVCVLIGPSGCGKSTTLRMINRLVEPTSGRIILDGDDITAVDAVQLRRRIGYVIQHVGLFPHLSVAANVATVPRLLGWDKQRTRERVEELLELVGLDPGEFSKRWPHELSGGQQQRIGVARALAADPPVLLMDEPFGAIDPITRHRLQQEFLRLQQRLRKTVVFVTHDLDEAVLVGDRIALLSEGGRLAQYAPPRELLGQPASPFVEAFVGRDRVLRRLAVVELDRDAVRPYPGDIAAHRAEPTVPLGASLREALIAVLSSPTGGAVAVDSEGIACGVITAEDVLAAARRTNAPADDPSLTQ